MKNEHTSMNKSFETIFTDSERDVIKFAVWHYMYEAVDRINDICKIKPINEDNFIELEVCLDNIRYAVSILSVFPGEEDYSYLTTKYTRKIEKIKRKFNHEKQD